MLEDTTVAVKSLATRGKTAFETCCVYTEELKSFAFQVRRNVLRVGFNRTANKEVRGIPSLSCRVA